MKVPGSVRDAFQQCMERREGMKERVDALLISRKHPRWHYESRYKALDSFALKLETGRVSDPLHLEDFFGCTLVVENQGRVEEAEKLVGSLFETKRRRPKVADRTWKRPTDFSFDDLRLYVQWRDDPAQPAAPFSGITFEVQVKTFLQHAWGIATHDLVYKSDRYSWPLQRVAYEVKAMLEHAEVSISRAEDLATTSQLNTTSAEFAALQDVVDFLSRHWPPQALPSDRCRLADTISGLLRRLGIALPLLETCLQAETAAGRGAHSLDLSPFGILVQALLNQRPDVFERLRRKDPTDRFCVFVPREIEGAEQLAARAPSRVVTL